MSVRKSTGKAAAAIFIIAVIAFLITNVNKEKEKEIITQSTLEKIINVSELSTYEAIYNGITQVANKEKPEKVDYYVYYEAKVKAGIDFEKVDIQVDNERKKILVRLPPVKITEVNVDIASLDYIFENKRANTGTVSQEAYKAAIEDVTAESVRESAIYEIAGQNAENIVEALVRPFVNQLDSQYELEIQGGKQG